MLSNKIFKKTGMILLFICTCGLFGFENLFANQMELSEILEKADQARGSASGIQWTVEIKSVENNRERHQTLIISSRDFNVLAETISPAKSKGRKLLMIDRNMWFAKPGLRKPVPISPRQKLMGGASNGDLASTNYAGDYKIDKATECTLNGETCFVFSLTAENKKVTYDQIRYWISKKRQVGVKSEFYTVSGKLLKTAVFEYDNSISINGTPQIFISKMIISDTAVNDNTTILSYGDIKLKKISNAVFNLNLLMR